MRESLAAVLLMAVLPSAAFGDPSQSMRAQAEKLHRESIVIDGHNDIATWILDCGFDLGMDGADQTKRNSELWWILGRFLPLPPGDQLRTHTDLRRLELGGVDAQFFSIFSDPRRYSAGEFKSRAIDMIEAVKEQVSRHGDELALAVSARDVRDVAGTGRIAVLMGLEGGHVIEDDLANLRLFHGLGVRYMTLTWSNTNNWADSSTDVRRHGGLTEFGREIVREMNRLGMMVDVSHVSDETFWDALEVTTAPIIASHSSARALVDIPRNMSDEMLRAVARNGGLVMVNFGGSFIDPRKAGTWRIVEDAMLHLGTSATPLDRLLDHIEHVARVAGVDHVGLGSDFDGTLFLPIGARDVSGFPNITAGLLGRGYSEDQIRKILGENLLRVFAEAPDGKGPGCIAKAGNRHVRAMAIEIAWVWLRFQPASALTQWYEQRFGHGSSRLRRIGIVALLRRLLITLALRRGRSSARGCAARAGPESSLDGSEGGRSREWVRRARCAAWFACRTDRWMGGSRHEALQSPVGEQRIR